MLAFWGLYLSMSIFHQIVTTNTQPLHWYTASKIYFQFHLSQLFHIFYDNGSKLNKDKLLTNKIIYKLWSRLDHEYGQLIQGFGDHINVIITMMFILKRQVYTDRKVAYSNFVCNN